MNMEECERLRLNNIYLLELLHQRDVEIKKLLLCNENPTIPELAKKLMS